MDDAKTWDLIHQERATMVETLGALTPSQWAEPSLCGGWTVQIAAGHIVVGAEQSRARFFKRMAANGFRFNTMMDRDARRTGSLPTTELIERLRATTSTTNRPPAPAMTMLGEIVVHSEDIRRPLGLASETSPGATVACLNMFKAASFPIGSKKRIAGLRLAATDVDWAHGDGPEISGTGLSLMLAMTGRAAGLGGLSGEGLTTLRTRMVPAS